ncbi:MAG: flavin reductase family protein, partial [Rhodobacteraceae bacterium]|nr:flavin reductase family protein [Paracoccaceae bacterium]
RNAFGSFATGVTVITTRQTDDTPRGFTANSFSSASLDPPLLLVCLAKSAHSCDVFAKADHFSVNVLADDQKEISGLFASQSPDKFNIAAWHAGPLDMPVIDNALTSFTCARHRLVDAGDHLILIGRVLSHSSTEAKPLGFFRGAYFDIGLENSLADAAAGANHVSIGAVLAKGNSVLLELGRDGAVSVPKAPSAENTVEGLAAYLKQLGVTPKLDHLYAVFQNTQNGTHSIIYHGIVAGDAPGGMGFFDLNALPLERVESEAEQSMLRRFQRENRHGAFGIYHGTEIKGVVHAVAGYTGYHV